MDHKFADTLRSRQETADILKISLKTLHRMELDGTGPVKIKLTQRLFAYRDSAINAFLEARSASSSAA